MDANTWLWILAGFLAAIFLGTGVLKLTHGRDELVGAGLAWAAEYPVSTLRALGWAEVVGAVALVVPPLVGVGILTPIAAVVLALLTLPELGAHVRRGALVPDGLRALALVALCVLLAAYRFGPEAF